MPVLMKDLHNLLGRCLQAHQADQSGQDAFEKTVLLVVSFFSILQTLISTCDQFDWSKFPTFAAFVKHGKNSVAQYVGALALRDYTWLQFAELDQNEVDSESLLLKNEMLQFPSVFAPWLCDRAAHVAIQIDRLYQGALLAVEHIKFELEYQPFIHVMDGLAGVLPLVVQIQCEIPGPAEQTPEG